MKLSNTWLKDYVDLEVSPKEYSDKMTMSGSKVEGYEVLFENITNVVVGKIVSAQKHPDADKLQVCMVDVGKDELIQIVTGATNIKAGDLVPVALDGATVSNGSIKKSRLRGIESNGMLCSIGELGLTKNDYPDACEDGIFILDSSLKIGQDIKQALDLNDIVYEFEITSNRADCFSVIGLARETAATFDKKIKLSKPQVKNTSGDINEYLSVSVENKELCQRYMAAMVKNVRIKESPRWLKKRLSSSGVRPINNIVDITNFVMLEYGQPMHAFDYDYIEGKKINVRTAKPKEKIYTLDGIERALDESCLLICDDKKPIGVAGVMGGENSEIKDTTKTIVFESANFKGSSVRKTAKKIGVRTESSSRFEKGLWPSLCEDALNRALELVELLDAGDIVGGCIDIKDYSDTKSVIDFDYEYVNKFIGIDIGEDEMVKILEKLEFEVKDKKIIVPDFRQDVLTSADICEEVARIYGYDKIPSTLFKGTVTKGGYDRVWKIKRDISQSLLSMGLSEIQTYSFISPKYYDNICLDKALRKSVVISNPLGEDTSIMRTTSLPSMLEVLSKNYAYRNEEVELFELACVYIPNEDLGKLPEEKTVITVGMYGKNVDFYFVKSVCDTLFENLKIKGEIVYTANENISYYHPGRCADISIDGQIIGTVGQINPCVSDNYDIETEVYAAMIDFNMLIGFINTDIKYKRLPKYPASVRDIAIICDKGLEVFVLEKAIKEAAAKLLEKVELFDIYVGEQVGANKKSVAYKITLRAEEKTLEDEEVNRIIQKVLKNIEKVGGSLRI